MRHKKKGRKLNRTSAHRKATRQNLAKALIEHERIITTPAKAKEARSFVEKLITLARKAQPYKNAASEDERAKYVHYYRRALTKLQDKKLVQKLFGEGKWREEEESLAERYADRPSGQTRIMRLSGSRLGNPLGYAIGDIAEVNYQLGGEERKIKFTGNRLGDNAEQVIFELIQDGEGAEEEDMEPEIDISGESENAEAEATEEEQAPDESDIAEEDAPVEETDVQDEADEGKE